MAPHKPFSHRRSEGNPDGAQGGEAATDFTDPAWPENQIGIEGVDEVNLELLEILRKMLQEVSIYNRFVQLDLLLSR